MNEMIYLVLAAFIGFLLGLLLARILDKSKANKILRDIDRDYGFRLKCSDLPQQWATFCDADND